jgi:hypothetical protein
LVIAQDARFSTRKRKAYWPCVCDLVEQITTPDVFAAAHTSLTC